MDVKGVGKEEAVFIQAENGNKFGHKSLDCRCVVGPSMIHVVYQYLR